MRRTLLVLLVGALGVAGCTSTISGRPQGVSTGSATSNAGGPSAGNTDVGACSDGDCEITLSGKTTIPLDSEFGIDSLSAEVSAGRVRLSYRGFGGSGEASLSGSGAVSIGGITARVLSISGGTATLRFTPR